MRAELCLSGAHLLRGWCLQLFWGWKARSRMPALGIQVHHDQIRCTQRCNCCIKVSRYPPYEGQLGKGSAFRITTVVHGCTWKRCQSSEVKSTQLNLKSVHLSLAVLHTRMPVLWRQRQDKFKASAGYKEVVAS